MSDPSSRRLRPKDAALFAKTGGDFAEEALFVTPNEGGFVAWGKTSFKVVEDLSPVDLVDEYVPEAKVTEPDPESVAVEVPQETDSANTAPVAHDATQAEPLIPPPLIQEAPVNSADIIAEIEKAREDGRALGYQQGLTAARQELADSLATLRRLEEQLVPATEDVLEKNIAVMAQHVRRIAQDLAGNVFATIPDMFIERIRKSADMFTRAGSEFTLAINTKDAQSLMPALRGEDLFKNIKIIEDPHLPNGGFRLTGRDLEVEDTPELLGLVEDVT
jgi:flagellar biosynthesis/type III secretory pathway protein FliH